MLMRGKKANNICDGPALAPALLTTGETLCNGVPEKSRLLDLNQEEAECG